MSSRCPRSPPGGAVYIDPADKNAGGFFTVPKVME